MFYDQQTKKHVYYVLGGGFLEKFDLYLYIHFAYIIDKVFAPVDDPFMRKILLVFSFCSVRLLQPLGAWVWGTIGDRKGRKSIIVVTAVLMGISSILFPLVPPYSQVGIWGFVIVLMLRALQGFACIGDSIAVSVYITESVPQKTAGFWTSIACVIDGFAEKGALALGVLCLYLDPDNGWKYPFIFGGCVALLSIQIRKRITDSREFLAVEQVKKSLFEQAGGFLGSYKENKGKFWRFVGIKTLFGFGFFFVYLYCSDLLRSECGLSSSAIFANSFAVSALQTVAVFLYGWMSLRMDAVQIVRYRSLVFILLLPICFFILSWRPYSHAQIFIVQVLIATVGMDHIPCLADLLRSMPILARMRLFGLAFSVGKTSMYVLTSFGIVLIEGYFGTWGILPFYLSVALLFAYCIWTFPQRGSPIQASGVDTENK